MTDEELRNLVASLAVSQKETDEQSKQTDVQIKKTSAQIEKLRASQEETGRKLDKVAKMIGGIGANQGDVAEDFFYNSFVKDNHLGSLSFDEITKNMTKHKGDIQEEYDIFLTNGDSIAIIEVKYKAHHEDVIKLERKIRNFKKLFPFYNDYKLYGAMASFHFNKDAKNAVLKQGYFAVERCGELISTENNELKVA